VARIVTSGVIKNSNFTIWTHRGRPEPEHCERAFDIAWMSGITNFEIDIRKTKDHQVVLTHDSGIKRISGVDLEISDLTLSELQEHPIDGLHPWVTLDQFLTNFPSAKVSIDFKSDDVLHPGIEVLRNFPNMDIVNGSFSRSRTLTIRKELPHFRSALTPFEVIQVMTGITPQDSKTHKLNAMVPRRQYGIEVVTPRFVRTCNRAGIEIHVWVINQVSEAAKLLELGVHGLVTDDFRVISSIKN
jgi:glycerophosphoryl diester phosphodiesterase